MVFHNKLFYNSVFDHISCNYKFMKEIWKLARENYCDVGEGIFEIYFPNVELFFKNGVNINVDAKYIKQKLLSSYEQEVLNNMDAENQICVRIKFIREDVSVATFMNNIYN